MIRRQDPNDPDLEWIKEPGCDMGAEPCPCERPFRKGRPLGADATPPLRNAQPSVPDVRA